MAVYPRLSHGKEHAGLGHRKQFSENVRITCVLAEQSPTNVLCRTIQGGGGRNPRSTLPYDYLQGYISCLLLRIIVKFRCWVVCLYESIQIWGLRDHQKAGGQAARNSSSSCKSGYQR
jgi:hypothetical protein